MKKNMSGLERIVRLILGGIFVILFLTHVASGPWGWVVLIIGILLIITGLIGFSPIYALLSGKSKEKTNTKK